MLDEFAGRTVSVMVANSQIVPALATLRENILYLEFEEDDLYELSFNLDDLLSDPKPV